MPVSVKRHVIEVSDINEKKYSVPYYSVFIFRKEVPVILLYLSKGLDFTIDYLGMIHVMEIIDSVDESSLYDTEYLYFPLSSRCYIKVDKELFDKYIFVQSVVGAFSHVTTSRVTIQQLNDPKVWIKKTVNPANYEKGLSIVQYSNRLLDETTQKILKLPEYYKHDIFAVLKWIMQNYNALRLKDNCDLANSFIGQIKPL